MKQAGIYAIICTVTGKQYIGSSSDLHNRWLTHRSHLRNGRGAILLQRAWNKYGEEAFIFTILEYVENPDELIAREQHYLDTLRPALNARPIAERNSGMHFTEEHIEHMRQAKANISPEARNRMSAAKKGKVPLLATEASARATRGKERSAEVKRKISETKRRRAAEGVDTYYSQFPRDEYGRFIKDQSS